MHTYSEKLSANQVGYNHLSVIRRFGGKKMKRCIIEYSANTFESQHVVENVFLVKKLDKIMLHHLSEKVLSEVASLNGISEYMYKIEDNRVTITMSEEALDANWIITMEF